MIYPLARFGPNDAGGSRPSEIPPGSDTRKIAVQMEEALSRVCVCVCVCMCVEMKRQPEWKARAVRTRVTCRTCPEYLRYLIHDGK